jgi:hypothetical protein
MRIRRRRVAAASRARSAGSSRRRDDECTVRGTQSGGRAAVAGAQSARRCSEWFAQCENSMHDMSIQYGQEHSATHAFSLSPAHALARPKGRRLGRGPALREVPLQRGALSLLGRRPRLSARTLVSLSAIARALRPRATSTEAAFSRRALTQARSSRCTRSPHPEVLGAQGEATAPCASTGATALPAKREPGRRRERSTERARWMRGRCAMRGAFPWTL